MQRSQTARMRVALISDSHLSQRAPECVGNWRAAASAVSAMGPDLSVHLGDITLDGQSRPEELLFAAELLHHWPTPMRWVVGNHDMGTGCGEEPIAPDTYAMCLTAFGPDHWTCDADGWTLIGVNAQLFGTASAQEAAQRDWLCDVARELNPNAQVVLLSHRPVLRPVHDLSMPTGRYVQPDWARWLTHGPLQRRLRVVASGHTHQSLSFVTDGVQHIWVPSSSFVISDALQKPVGAKLVALGWLELSAGRSDYCLVMPPGARAHELTGMGFYRDSIPHGNRDVFAR